jgi:hypothetical protein
MQGLRGIRMAACTESEETDEFAEGNVKRLTGEAYLTSRALYSDYVTFATTQLVRCCILTLSPPKLKESLGLEVVIKQSDHCFSLGREFPKRYHVFYISISKNMVVSMMDDSVLGRASLPSLELQNVVIFKVM